MCKKKEEEIETLEPKPVCEIFTLDQSKQDKREQPTEKSNED